jgi:DNA processing protein
MQINQILPAQSDFPALLSEIPNPPQQLYVLGDIPTGTAVAIVGTRRPSAYGKQVTYQLAYELAQAGLTIVSGLALGIDGIAHRAALDAGGTTVAVQACSLDRIYPESHRGLATEILAKGGAIISEYGVPTEAFKSNFIMRNRLISGLASGVLVTEAGADSGSMHTVNHALAQNRTVMAVPGHITSERSAGPNNLLRNGATPVTGTSDVIAAINFDTNAVAALPVRAQSPEEAKILELIRSGINSSQQLIETSGYSASQFANIIGLMEITGKVRNLGAGSWSHR